MSVSICSDFHFVFHFFLRCSAIKVAHTGQTIEQSVENVVRAVSEIAKIVPRGWNNIQSLNLKTSDSISLPIYTSLPEKSLAIDDTQPPKKKRKMDTWNTATLTVTVIATEKRCRFNKSLAFLFGFNIQSILPPLEARSSTISDYFVRQEGWLVHCDLIELGAVKFHHVS